jgi:hypothetical protein
MCDDMLENLNMLYFAVGILTGAFKSYMFPLYPQNMTLCVPAIIVSRPFEYLQADETLVSKGENDEIEISFEGWKGECT